MKTTHSTLSAVLASTILAVSAPLARAADTIQLYKQEFDTSSDKNVTIGSLTTSTVGWVGLVGSEASTNASSRVYVAPPNGNPSSDGAGYLAFTPGSGADDKIFTATTLFSSPLDLQGATISWTMGNSTVNATVQLLVNVGGNWYASNTVFQNAGMTATVFAETATSDVLRTLDFSTAKENWRSFTLTSGVVMSLGDPLENDLSSSLVSGIGFFVTFPSTATNGTARIDTLTIVGPASIPEPGSAALLLGMGAMAWTASRRGGRR
jgi:hypothetical protein